MDRLITFFESIGVDRWNFCVLDGDSMLGDSRERDRAEVEKSLAWGRAMNAKGLNVYIRPARRDDSGELRSWPVVFLDDITPALATGITRKYRAIAVETSQDNCQVWIACDKSLTEEQRKAVQEVLIAKAGADIKSKSGDHYGRAIGFRNKKAERDDFKIRILAVGQDGLPLFSTDSVLNIDKPHTSPPKGGACAPRLSTVSGSDAGSNSSIEFAFACHALERGEDPDAIAEKIAQRALDRGKRNSWTAALKYATSTVDNAIATRGRLS